MQNGQVLALLAAFSFFIGAKIQNKYQFLMINIYFFN